MDQIMSSHDFMRTDELDDFMYTETVQCLSVIDPTTPEYVSIDGIQFIQYCSESMADIVHSVNHCYSIETVYRLSETILERFQIVAELGLNQYDLSFQLYNNLLEIRRETKEIDFDSWAHGWTKRCEEDTSDDDDMSYSDENDIEVDIDEKILLPGINAFDERSLENLFMN